MIVTLLVSGTALCCVTMLGLFVVQQRTENAGYVDVGWSYNLGLLGLLYAGLGSSSALPRWTLAAMAMLWSLRLGTHILRRVHGHAEEGRYAALRQHWGQHTGLKFFFFFQAQAILDVLLSLPFLLVAIDRNGSAAFTSIQVVAIALFLVAIAGEALADGQLARFKRTAAKGAVCEMGLWSYSRHPNYFFEWLIWVAYALFATSTCFGWFAWTAPALMLLFLFKVTGIPYTEAQSLRSKGEAYARYQRTTSVFIPWFKKEPTL
ncbi:DUF1295 domain-containing protein [Granulicella arctica]|uniref:Steroid 5-alpha reductase family enzyme n=1 Tax=Granulicella arctica TaxID=940613 RepID=A0A7Y9TFC7_9BACT|nr:DUF1295 domain-containing protein [Granulicella arctica]NYF78611.1 steroid 5-alpha reductase family enzyme [Granulicella arctica]